MGNSERARAIVRDARVVSLAGSIHESSEGHPDVAHCKGFMLDEQQVKEFFERADDLEPGDAHDEYYWLPCYVEGRFEVNDEAYDFSINAGSTGVIFFSENEEAEFGCKEACKDIFDYGFYEDGSEEP